MVEFRRVVAKKGPDIHGSVVVECPYCNTEHVFSWNPLQDTKEMSLPAGCLHSRGGTLIVTLNTSPSQKVPYTPQAAITINLVLFEFMFNRGLHGLAYQLITSSTFFAALAIASCSLSIVLFATGFFEQLPAPIFTTIASGSFGCLLWVAKKFIDQDN